MDENDPLPQANAVMTGDVGPATLLTVNEMLHDFPAKLSGKLAIPTDVGVPLTVKEKFPVPLANTPACSVAVRPITPVDAMAVPAVKLMEFPPVYGTVAVPE